MIEETAIRSMLMELDVPPHKLDVSKPDTTKWLLDNLRVRNVGHVAYAPIMENLILLCERKNWLKHTRLKSYREHVAEVKNNDAYQALKAMVKTPGPSTGRMDSGRTPPYHSIPAGLTIKRAREEADKMLLIPRQEPKPGARLIITMPKARPPGTGMAVMDAPYGLGKSNGPRRQRGRINEEATAVRLEEELNRKT